MSRPTRSNETRATVYDIFTFLLRRVDWRSDRGQATTEYALVLLAAALVGLLVIAWATTGGGAAAISGLFDRVIQSVTDRV